MIILGTNFKLKSTSPNFERDNISSDDLLITSKDITNKYDIGHIVYCNEGTYTGKHFIYRGEHKDGYVGLFEEVEFYHESESINSIDPISAMTEGKFVYDIQKILDKNAKSVGFVAPIILYSNTTSTSSADTYIFQDFMPSGATELYAEANVRKDGKVDGKTIFHLDFELDIYSIQYWYKGGTESAIYYVKYSLSDNAEDGPKMVLVSDEGNSSGGGE